MRRVFGWTRFLVLLGVAGSFVMSATLFVASLAQSLRIAVEIAAQLGDAQAVGPLIVESIRHADDFLIATGLYLISTGLYTLFIGPVNLPAVLQVASLDDLKQRLIGVVVAVMAVTFLGEVADWDGQRNVLFLGASIAAVIVALAVHKRLAHDPSRET
jgi:uncharacterized membrane protein YqhA